MIPLRGLALFVFSWTSISLHAENFERACLRPQSRVAEAAAVLRVPERFRRYPRVADLIREDPLLLDTLERNPMLRIVFLVASRNGNRDALRFFENIPPAFNTGALMRMIDRCSGFSVSNSPRYVDALLKKGKTNVVACLTDDFSNRNVRFDVSHGRSCFKPVRVRVNGKPVTVLLVISGSGRYNGIGDGINPADGIVGQEEKFAAYNRFFPVALASRRIDLPKKKWTGGIDFTDKRIPLLFNIDLSFYRLNNVPSILDASNTADFLERINSALSIMDALEIPVDTEPVSTFGEYLDRWMANTATVLGYMHGRNEYMLTPHVQDYSVVPGILCDRKEIRPLWRRTPPAHKINTFVFEILVAFHSFDALLAHALESGILETVNRDRLAAVFFEHYFRHFDDERVLALYNGARANLNPGFERFKRLKDIFQKKPYPPVLLENFSPRTLPRIAAPHARLRSRRLSRSPHSAQSA
jgi:hypothetical protein